MSAADFDAWLAENGYEPATATEVMLLREDFEHRRQARANFDAWLAEHPSDDLPGAFASWLAEQTGDTVIGLEVDGDGAVIATPDEP